MVAKDPARKAVITASQGGVVRAVRAPAKVRTLRIGQRVAVCALPLADGTFRSQRIKVAGRAAKATIRGVLVKRDRANRRYLVSAGGSVLPIRSKGRRALVAIAGGEKPGEKVVVRTNLSSGTPTATNVDGRSGEPPRARGDLPGRRRRQACASRWLTRARSS